MLIQQLPSSARPFVNSDQAKLQSRVKADDGKLNRLTVETVRALTAAGFRPVPVKRENPRQFAYRDYVSRSYSEEQFLGYGIAIRTGTHADGTWLCRIDLDKHTEGQDPHAIYMMIQEALGDEMARCAVKRSTSGSGIDILFLSPIEQPNNQRIFVGGQHVGELFCVGGRVVVEPAEWLEGSLMSLELLSEEGLEKLLGFVTTYSGTRNPTSWTARAREGGSLIHGYERILTTPFRGPNGMPKTFNGSQQPHRIAQDVWRRLASSHKGERSEVIAHYLQSVMILASDSYGATTAERCQTVAALVIEDYLSKNTDKNPSQIEQDVAALIARVLHSAPYKNREGNFKCPYWADEYRQGVRSPGRPKGDKEAQLGRLRKLLSKEANGDRVETIGRNKQRLTIALLAKKLGVSERTMKRYVTELEQRGEIKRASEKGRNGHLVIKILPMFGQAKGDKKRPEGDRKCTGGVTENVPEG